jgi:2-polyprenyl-6-methoxyphenol hydroxylase-like FAD-dependent oxidoreductase
MAFMPGRYSIVFPQGGGRARTYIIGLEEKLADLRGRDRAPVFIDACAANLPAGALGAPRAAGPLAFFPGADIWADRAAGNGVALVGDAAGANDPSLGNGLSIAFRDALELRDWLLAEQDWEVALRGYAERRAAYYAVLRAHATWQTRLWLDLGPEADVRRARAQRAAEVDPERMGFGTLTARGPDGVVLSEEARARFHGEDLPDA